jgi:zinc transport system ATP-binding protein
MIQIEDLTLFLNGKAILEDINLKVNQGDFLAIIGPNGGGKSTLIRCLLGFLKPQKGQIILWGKPISVFRDWHKIGYLPQRAGKEMLSLNPITLGEFLFLPSRWYKKPVDLEYLRYLLETFGLEGLVEKKICHLSFGQLQRAYLVRALLLKPEILILDEPSVGLDFISQEAFYQLLSDFHQRGLTIILITHETWLLTREINKVACLNHRLYYHGEHEDFCALAGEKVAEFPFHRIEHLHW